MSTFSKLKQQRKEKETSHTKNTWPDEQIGAVQRSTCPVDVEHLMVEVQPGSMKQTSYHPEGLYGSLPRDLEISVHMDETGKGRGIYNLRQRKPGRPHIDFGDARFM
jgi:hypothetical protein